MPTQVSYPAGQSVGFRPGVGMHDISLLATGNGWSGASITAHAGGTRTPATPVTAACTLIAVSATSGDSVMLPPALGGQVLWLINAGAASSQIFANTAGSDTINGVAAATGIALAAGKAITLVSPIVGAWFGILSA